MSCFRVGKQTFFEDILPEYSRLVKNGFYNKISYDIWSKFQIIGKMTFYEAPKFRFKADCLEIRFHYYAPDPIEETVRVANKDFWNYCYKRVVKEGMGESWSYASPPDFDWSDFDWSKAKSDNCYFINDKGETITFNTVKEREEKNMKGFNFDFGTCENDNVKMSAYGLAIRNNANTWVSYNPKTGEIIDVDILNFDCGKFLFKMPVAINAIKKGMTVIHNRIPMFVLDVTNTGIVAIDPRAGEQKTIIPTKNMFGFNFITQIVSMFDFNGGNPAETASEQNPFGNMLPFLMMSDDMDSNTMMMMAMAMNGGAGMMNNPMMMLALMGDKSNKNIDNILPMMFMMNSTNAFTAPKAE